MAAPRLALRLRRMTWEAPGVLSLELVEPGGGTLPPFGPGAHVELRLPDGQERPYSLCGDPADLSAYRVAVREVAGGRASRLIHRALRPGEMLDVGPPRNNFPFVEAERYLFVAGGIGVTPLMPMMREAGRRGRPWTLLFCARRAADAPFLAEARGLPGGEVVVHASAEGTRLDVAATLAAPRPGTVLYCCGPESLMAAVEAATERWPEGSVRFEWFAPRARPDGEESGGFEVVCARSGLTVPVAAGQSILDALSAAGLDHPRSCEQGVCGTCEARVLEGEVDHRDSLLSPAERASGLIMTCVSRAASPRLVLDL